MVMDRWFKIERSKPGDRMSLLVLDFRIDHVDILHPFDASVQLANRIYQHYKKRITVFASGGIDSQACIYAFKKAGNPFRIVHYSYGTNVEDTETLTAFCQQEGLAFELHHFDVDAFINSDEYLELANRYDCASPHILSYIKMVSNHDEPCVMSGNFVSRDSASMNWTISGLDRFRELDKPNFIPFFFQWSPELVYGAKLHKHDLIVFDSGYEAKAYNYRELGFPIIPQSDKLSGFEEIKNSYDSYPIESLLRLKWASQPSHRPFDILFRYSIRDKMELGDFVDNTILKFNLEPQ
jgi:hypothetical protein